MLVKLLRLLREAAIYGGGSLLSQLLTFLLLPVFTRQLSPTDYGVIGMLAVVPTIFSVLATSGMKSALFQRFGKCSDDAERATMVSTAMFSTCLTIVVLAVIALLLSRSLAFVLFGEERAVLDVTLTILTAALAAAAEIPRAMLQSLRRAQAVTFQNLLQLVVTSAVTIALVVGKDAGVHGVVVGALVGQVVATTLGIWALRAWWSRALSFPMWKAMRAYGWPYLPHRIVGVVMVFYGDYVVRERLGLHQTGIYGMAARFAAPVGFLSSSLLQAWQPFKFKILAEDPDPKNFFASTFTYFAAVFAYLLIGLSAWGPELIRLMTAPEFHEATSLVWALALMRVMQGAYPLLATGVDVGDNTKQVPLASLVSLIVLVAATMALVPPLGALGAAVGTMLSWAAMGVAFYFISRRIYPIPYDWKAVLAIGGLAGLFVCGSRAWQPLPVGLRISAAVVASLSFPATIWFVLGRSQAERHRMALLVGAFRARLSRSRSGA